MPAVNYLWDPDEDNIVKEIDDAGTTIADYTTEPYLYGDVISQLRSGQSRFYHFDTQGNTTELTDSGGDTTDTRRYSAFGESTESAGSTNFPFQFNGRTGSFLDAFTGQYRARGLSYEPLRRRWLSRRLVEIAGAIHGYSFFLAEAGNQTGVLPQDNRLRPSTFPFDIGYQDSHCQDCRHFHHQWNFYGRGDLIKYIGERWGSVLIQKFCRDRYLEYCEEDACGRCRGTSKTVEGNCCFYELVADTFEASHDKALAADVWSGFEAASPTEHPCDSWGFAKDSAIVRAFHFNKPDVDKIAWNPPGKLRCGKVDFEVGKHIPIMTGAAEPDWWKNNKLWSHQIVFRVNHIWNCCPVPKTGSAGWYTFYVDDTQFGPFPCGDEKRSSAD